MAKIKIITFGCSNNFAEAEIMAGLLQEQGHHIVEEKEDITIVNLCTVKGPSLNKGIKAAKASKGKLIFAGCIPKNAVEKLRKVNKEASLISTHNLERITEAVDAALKGERIELLQESKKIKLCFPRKRKNKVIAIIPIASGCVSSCSYCAVKGIKGQLFSFPPEKIIEEVEQSLKDGCREIWITAQDTGCYGLDIDTNLHSLLKQILEIEGGFFIRLGMANPYFIHKYLRELIEVFKNKNLFKFLHIPLQSGSDKILKDMGRKYSAKEFIEIVESFRKEIPEITISTDVIVGFPTETKEDFQDSIHTIKKIKPDILNLNRFWSMPGTKAAKLKQLPTEVLKERSLEMLKVFEPIALAQNRRWIGWKGKAIVDEIGKYNSFVARNLSYKPIIIKGSFEIGDEILLEIKQATEHDLRASRL